MSFLDCGGGKVWFQVGDEHDFAVSEGGVVSALRRLSLVGKEKAALTLYARDVQSKQVWKARVHLHVRPTSSTQLEVKAFFLISEALRFSFFNFKFFYLYFLKKSSLLYELLLSVASMLGGRF